MPVCVFWPSGDTDVAPDPETLLDVLAAQQPNDEDAANVRAALAWRCHVLGLPVVDVNADPDDFCRRLDEIGFWTYREVS